MLNLLPTALVHDYELKFLVIKITEYPPCWVLSAHGPSLLGAWTLLEKRTKEKTCVFSTHCKKNVDE